jgi:hypothetical protein
VATVEVVVSAAAVGVFHHAILYIILYCYGASLHAALKTKLLLLLLLLYHSQSTGARSRNFSKEFKSPT